VAVTLYVRNDSQPCRELRAELDRDGVCYTLVDVETNPELVPELIKLTGGRRIVPVLVDGATIRVAPNGGTEF
jgi:glutaredoxin